jgi:hypothetical protein
MAQRIARMNGREIITEADVPLTKGLQENMQAFAQMDEELSLDEILAHLAKLPPMDLGVGEDVEAMLPSLAGGLTVALAKVFKAVNPDLKNPQTEDWDKAEAIFGLLL